MKYGENKPPYFPPVAAKFPLVPKILFSIKY